MQRDVLYLQSAHCISISSRCVQVPSIPPLPGPGLGSEERLPARLGLGSLQAGAAAFPCYLYTGRPGSAAGEYVLVTVTVQGIERKTGEVIEFPLSWRQVRAGPGL